MKLRNPFLIRLAGFLGAWLIRLWMGTLHYRFAFLEGVHHPANHRGQRFIYSIWHEAILFPTLLKTKIHLLISHHADGELITQAVRHLGFQVVRGSTTRGGIEALRQLLEISKKTHLLVTPDGPRGPRRSLQLGLIFLASHTGLPIVPCGIAYANAWRARSWDQFAIPLPFTTAYGVTGPAIHVPKGLGKKKLEAYRAFVELQMLEMTKLAEDWARGKGRPVLATPAARDQVRRSA